MLLHLCLLVPVQVRQIANDILSFSPTATAEVRLSSQLDRSLDYKAVTVSSAK